MAKSAPDWDHRGLSVLLHKCLGTRPLLPCPPVSNRPELSESWLFTCLNWEVKACYQREAEWMPVTDMLRERSRFHDVFIFVLVQVWGPGHLDLNRKPGGVFTCLIPMRLLTG